MTMLGEDFENASIEALVEEEVEAEMVCLRIFEAVGYKRDLTLQAVFYLMGLGFEAKGN